jgi:hypothetical protein
MQRTVAQTPFTGPDTCIGCGFGAAGSGGAIDYVADGLLKLGASIYINGDAVNAGDMPFGSAFYDATDCTSLTGVKAVMGDVCWEVDDEALFVCEPSTGVGTNNGVCDNAAEWVVVGGPGASLAFTGDYDFGGGTLQVPNSNTLPGSCEVGDMYMDTDATDGQMFYLCDAVDTWELQGDGGGGGSSPWDDADPIVPSTTTRKVQIGPTQYNGAALSIDGQADVVQLSLQGHSTQTNPVVTVETSAGPGTDVITLNNDGDIKAQSIQDIDTGSSTWSVDTSGDAIFNSVQTGATATPTLTLDDSDTTEHTDDATIIGNATDDTPTTEDVTITFNVFEAGAAEGKLQIVGGGTVHIPDNTVEPREGALSIGDSAADAGAIRLENTDSIEWEAAPAGTNVALSVNADEELNISTYDCSGNSNGGVLTVQANGDVVCDDDDSAAGGQAVILDLADDESNESTDLGEIAVTGDTYSIFTEPSADKLLIAVGNLWPTAANVDASGAAAITIGSGDVTDITISTDGSGTNELVLPNNSVGETEIDDNAIGNDQMADNAVGAAEIAPITKTMYWGAGAMSTDGTNCADPTETTAGGAGGPGQYTINCPLTADGEIYGSTVLPDGFVGGASSNLVFELSAYIADDPGATEDLHSVIYAQCVGDGDAISSSWTNHDDINVQFVTGDAQWDIAQDDNTAFDPDGTCAAGDVLYWRLEVCQAVAGNCGTASTMDTTNTYLIGMKMEYTWDPATE